MEAAWPRMPWDHDNIVAFNHIHSLDGIMGDGGAIYTLGPQGNRPFRIGGVRPSYPPLPLPPLRILPMSRVTANWVHDNGWSERPRNSVPGDGTHGPGGIYLDNGSTGWNCSRNVFRGVTVWALACYTTGIDNNSFVNNTYVCTGGSSGRYNISWCGPLHDKRTICTLANNSNPQLATDFSSADLAVIKNAGPRPLQQPAATAAE